MKFPPATFRMVFACRPLLLFLMIQLNKPIRERSLNQAKQRHIEHGKQSTDLSVNSSAGRINLYIEHKKHQLDRIEARNIRMSLRDKCIAFSKEIYASPRTIVREQNMLSVIRIYLLNLQTVTVIAAGPGEQYRIQASNMFTVYFIFCPSKANSW